jgi:hypothetical protein
VRRREGAYDAYEPFTLWVTIYGALQFTYIDSTPFRPFGGSLEQNLFICGRALFTYVTRFQQTNIADQLSPWDCHS